MEKGEAPTERRADRTKMRHVGSGGGVEGTSLYVMVFLCCAMTKNTLNWSDTTCLILLSRGYLSVL
jgi:hypothetical protein